MTGTTRSCIRIGSVSGATGDSPTAMKRMAEEAEVDVIVGDWLSEMNIAWNAIAKREDPQAGYEVGFLDQLEGCIDTIVGKGIKVVTNAGALNTPGLTAKVKELCMRRGHTDVVIAAVIGDDISDDIGSATTAACVHLDHPEWTLGDWEMVPVCGVAYIGAWGVAEALKGGADIVICGRVTDASPVMGAAAWWHGWARTSFDELAASLVAGHLVECGPYVTGANYSGFKPMLDLLVDLAFPICEIAHDGGVVISKAPGHGGAVTVGNTIAQLLYELQGELYLNPDVVADLGGITIESCGRDRVRVGGVRGLPPPSTTKAMIAGLGGYQAEATFYINGLDVQEKAQLMRRQLERAFSDSNFSKLSITLYGSVPGDPQSQAEGTVALRVFVQARKKEDIEEAKFRRLVYALRMQSYPGYHMNLDFRTMMPKAFMEIFPIVFPMSSVRHQIVLPGRQPIDIPISSVVRKYDVHRISYETANPVDVFGFGTTQRAPLGSIVHARSGDKANNSNVGFFVRHPDEYPWLQSFMTARKVKELFGEDWKEDYRVERCEFPKILAVHFRVLDFLDGGIASSSRIDGLGKGVGEYLRSRVVDIPTRFLERGWI